MPIRLPRLVSLQCLFIALGLLSIGYFIYISWPEVSKDVLNMDIGLFFVAFISFLLSMWLSSRVFQLLATGYDQQISPKNALTLVFLSQITKYIPGKVWVIFFQKALLGSTFSFKHLFAINLRLMMFIALTMVFTSIVLACIFSGYYVLCLIFLPALFLSHWILTASKRFMHFEARFEKLKWISLGFNGKVKASESFLLMLGLSLSSFTTICLVYLALYDISFIFALKLSVTQQIAWVVSSFFFFIPVGLGVREGIFIMIGDLFALANFEDLIAMAAAYRILLTLHDLMVGCMGYLIFRIKFSDSLTSKN